MLEKQETRQQQSGRVDFKEEILKRGKKSMGLVCVGLIVGGWVQESKTGGRVGTGGKEIT